MHTKIMPDFASSPANFVSFCYPMLGILMPSLTNVSPHVFVILLWEMLTPPLTQTCVAGPLCFVSKYLLESNFKKVIKGGDK